MSVENVDFVTSGSYREKLDMRYIILKSIMSTLEGAASPNENALSDRVLGLLNVVPSEVYERIMAKTDEYNYRTTEWEFHYFCNMKMGSQTRLMLTNGKTLEIKDMKNPRNQGYGLLQGQLERGLQPNTGRADPHRLS
jgi:hypothetical protein